MLSDILNAPELKKIIFMFIAIPLGIKCFGQSGSFPSGKNNTLSHTGPDSIRGNYKFISSDDAEKILGQKSYVKDSSWKEPGGILKFMTNIIANSSDKATGQYRKLFFDFELYTNDSLAKVIYASIKAENKKTLTVITLDETGDEAFWVKDQVGNPFLMIRKDKKIFKLKIYNVTSKGAFEQLQSLARRIVSDN